MRGHLLARFLMLFKYKYFVTYFILSMVFFLLAIAGSQNNFIYLLGIGLSNVLATIATYYAGIIEEKNLQISKGWE